MIPAHPDGLTAEWLTDALRATRTLKHAKVTSLTIHVLGHEKGMTGQLARLSLDYDTYETDAPHSLIAKFTSPDPQARAMLHTMGFYE